ncbi:MAG: hypothetical protein QM572_01405 [Nocardioides sp.]|uniref:hypothetical protein n=1 Tax=Nocardioides sp. TaxID=35761 RepID=UPI0039E5FF9A
MSHDLNYVWEKFYRATVTLARSNGDLAPALAEAYLEHIQWALPPGRDVAPDLAAGVEEVQRRMTQRPDPGDGSGTVRASVQLMTAEELREVAEQIVEIAFDLSRQMWSDR